MLEPPVPKARKPIRSGDTEEYRIMKKENNYLKNNLQRSHMEDTYKQQKNSHLSQSMEYFNDGDSSEYEEEIIDQKKIDKKEQSHHSQNRSRTTSPEKPNVSSKKAGCSTTRVQPPQSKQEKAKSRKYLIFLVFVLVLLSLFMFPFSSLKMNKTQPRSNNDHNSLFKSIKDVEAKFHNQESDSWNDISSAINEVISRNPKVPSIILLFGNETSTMDCLATELAHVSSIILHTDDPKNFNPEDFGDNVGDIINTVKKYSPPVKVMVIRDILNINAEAIKALHFLCDRVSPLIDEAIYILTMQTNNYQSSMKRLSFVEEHIRRKLSKSIDQDILMPLITRITDGAIISVQPEPNLKHCKINLSEL